MWHSVQQFERRVQFMQDDMEGLKLTVREVPGLREDLRELQTVRGDQQSLRDEMAHLRNQALHHHDRLETQMLAVAEEVLETTFIIPNLPL